MEVFRIAYLAECQKLHSPDAAKVYILSTFTLIALQQKFAEACNPVEKPPHTTQCNISKCNKCQKSKVLDLDSH